MSVVVVDQMSDPLLDDYRDLTDVALRSTHEPACGLYMAEGEKVIARALSAGHRPRSVLVARKWLPTAQRLLDAWPETPVYLAPADLVADVTGYRVHRGFLAAMHRPAPSSVAEATQRAARVLVLADLVDHTNVGAAFRSAAALGFDSVVVSPRCADPLYRRSIKVSMGAVLSMPWARAQRWPDVLHELGTAGFTVLALTPQADARDLAEVASQAPERVALVIGTEGEGLSASAIAACHVSVRIPMFAGVDSLNAAAASAVACYALGPASAQRRGVTPGSPAPRTFPAASTG